MINTELFKEVSPLSAKDCFILIERQKSNFNFPIHIHPEYELNYIENAKGAQRIVGDSIEEIEEEELVLVTNPQLEHAWRDYNNKPQNIHEITIQFHSDLLSDQILNRNQMISIRELFHRARKGIVFSRETIAKVRPLLKTLSCENDSFYSLIKLLVILHELSLDKGMRELSTGQFAINSVSKEHTNEKLNKVLDYVHFHFSEVIRLADVAKMVNMSEASFCRFIKQHTSKSFIDFLTDIRLGAASRALVDSSLSIAEIGYVIMEPLLGGRLSKLNDHLVARLKQRRPENSVASWAFRFAGTYPNVLCVLSGMTYMEHLQDNLRTYSPLEPLNEEEKEFLEETAQLMLKFPTIPCNDCKYCMPCPYGLDIPAILVHYNKCVNEGNVPKSSQDENYRRARRAFLIGYDRSVPKLRQASHCTGCNQCNPHCPQSIDIPKELHRIDAYVEQLKQETL